MDKNLSYSVRLMRREDIAQVSEISREAFPTEWPPRNYRHEMQNQSVHYIVACDEEKVIERPLVKTYPAEDNRGLMSRIRRFFNPVYPTGINLPPSNTQFVVGFAGLWVIADEAHLTDIAVRETYRGRGIGELLLIASIDLSIEFNADSVTLEVRASNTPAQSLYYKYGFAKVGIRRGYYTDNREDAILMTVGNVNSASFQEHFQQLKKARSQKWGITSINLSASR